MLSSRRTTEHFLAAIVRSNVLLPGTSILMAPMTATSVIGVSLLPTASIASTSTPVISSYSSRLIGAKRYVAIEKQHYWANQSPTSYSKKNLDQWIQDFPNLSQYETEDIEKWRNAFDTYDHDSDGFISPADLQKNQNVSLQKVKLLKEADRDNNNLIDFGEFVSVISSLDVADIRRTYEGFDTVDIQLEFEKFAVQNHGGSQMVMHIPQLKLLMTYCDCICVTDKDAERLLSEIDTAGDGIIDFDEFKTVSSGNI